MPYMERGRVHGKKKRRKEKWGRCNGYVFEQQEAWMACWIVTLLLFSRGLKKDGVIYTWKCRVTYVYITSWMCVHFLLIQICHVKLERWHVHIYICSFHYTCALYMYVGADTSAQNQHPGYTLEKHTQTQDGGFARCVLVHTHHYFAHSHSHRELRRCSCIHTAYHD